MGDYRDRGTRVVAASILSVAVFLVANPAMGLDSIAKWTFDDDTAMDVTGNGNDGTIVGATPVGGALWFNGFNDYVVVPNSAELQQTTNWYLESRFKIDPNTPFSQYGNMTIVSKGATYGALYADYNLSAIDTGGERGDHIPDAINCEVSPPSGPHTGLHASDNIADGKWHTAGALFANGKVTLTLDGKKMGSTNLGFNGVRTSNQPLYIGRRYTGNYGTNHTSPFSGWIDEVSIKGLAAPGGETPSPPPTRLDLPTKSSTARNLVFVTHGWNADRSDWGDGLAYTIANTLNSGNDTSPVDDGTHAAYQMYSVGDWDIVSFDWSDEAHTGTASWQEYIINPLAGAADSLLRAETAYRRGKEIGANVVGSWLAAQNYEHVHFIGHSAGSGLIDEAAREVVQLQGTGAPEIHSTFLDPYLGITREGVSRFGEVSTWSDQYRALDLGTLGFTDADLQHAHNVDVTGLGDNIIPGISTHGYPITFYFDSFHHTYGDLNYKGYGILRSMELGDWAYAQTLAEGNKAIRLTDDTSVGQNSATPIVYLKFDDAIQFDVVPSIVSETGTASLQGPNSLTMTTGSPVWTTFLLDLVEPVNFVAFDYQFTSAAGAEGLLAVYWDDELIGTFDERIALDGVDSQILALPDTFGPGTFSLSFRLDPYTAVSSSVLISNVSTGLVTVVPEPASLGLLTLSGILSIRRRRAA